jgi:putative membrane protein
VRVLLSILLFIFVVALVTFIIQNGHSVEIRFLGWKQDAPMAVVSLGLYFLGMVSGWAVLGFLRRSVKAIREKSSE